MVAALMVSYASSLRAYVEQRRHLSSLQESIDESQRTIAELRREKRRWDDPAYVVSQARARFAFGFPGEIGYRVLDVDGKPLDQDDSLSEPRALEDPDPEWWQTTIDSIEAAGEPEEDRAPAERIAPPPRTKPDR